MQLSSRDAVRRKIFQFLTCVCLGTAMSCSSAPPVREETRAERVQRDNAIGQNLSQRMGPEFKFKRDTEVSVYLRKIAESLSVSTEELKGTSIGVFLIQDRDARWRNYGLPGNRIYLSVNLLKELEFENEVAAAIAMELAHVMERHALERLREKQAKAAPDDVEVSSYQTIVPTLSTELPKAIDYFGPNGIFAFAEESYLSAAEHAVGIMYRAGYDPRGLVSLWIKHKASPKHSPYEASTLDKLIEHTRRVNTQYAPLRNPIVRTHTFVAIQKRIRRL